MQISNFGQITHYSLTFFLALLQLYRTGCQGNAYTHSQRKEKYLSCRWPTNTDGNGNGNWPMERKLFVNTFFFALRTSLGFVLHSCGQKQQKLQAHGIIHLQYVYVHVYTDMYKNDIQALQQVGNWVCVRIKQKHSRTPWNITGPH